MVRAPVFMFRKFYLFNCSSPHISAFEAGQVTCCFISDSWLVNHSTYFSLPHCSFQLGRRVSLLDNLALLSPILYFILIYEHVIFYIFSTTSGQGKRHSHGGATIVKRCVCFLGRVENKSFQDEIHMPNTLSLFPKVKLH